MKKIVTTTISAGERPDLADPVADRFELGAELSPGLQVALGELLRLADLRAGRRRAGGRRGR